MTPTRQNQIEIRRTITPGGIDAWSIIFRDLYFGPRRLERQWTKPDAIRAAARLSRKMRTPFAHDRRRRAVNAAEQTKIAAYQKRQRLVAQRAAQRARKDSEA